MTQTIKKAPLFLENASCKKSLRTRLEHPFRVQPQAETYTRICDLVHASTL